jgi:hypothetical protein
LKKESSIESKVCEPEKSSMKKSPSRELKEQKLHGILHKSSKDNPFFLKLMIDWCLMPTLAIFFF